MSKDQAAICVRKRVEREKHIEYHILWESFTRTQRFNTHLHIDTNTDKSSHSLSTKTRTRSEKNPFLPHMHTQCVTLSHAPTYEYFRFYVQKNS